MRRLGLIVLGIVVCIAGLMLLRTSSPKSFLQLFWFHEPAPVPPVIVNPPPDSPVVIRGGSLNLFGNGVKWAPYQNVNYLFQADVGGMPTVMKVDGIDESGGIKIPVDDPLPPLTANWTISLSLRNNRGDGQPTQVNFCTQLNQSSTGCSTSPNGNMNGSIVYFEADHKDGNRVRDNSWDRPNSGARLHYAIPNCPLGNLFNGDLDPPCSKIKSLTMYGIPNRSGPYQCVDGACSIKVNHQ